MLSIRLEIEKINYPKCVEALLPPLVEHCAAKTHPNELDRFLAGLGAEAVSAACAVLDRMDTDERDQMVVWLAGSHEERMRNSANRHLSELLGGALIEIGRLIAVDRPGSRISLQAAQVRIDYPALLKSPVVRDGIDQIGNENAILKGAAKLAVQMGSRMPAQSLEKYCLSLLNAGKVKGRLMPVLADGLRQAGLDITLTDMVVESDDVIRLPETLPDASCSAAFEQKLMDSLAAWVRENRAR